MDKKHTDLREALDALRKKAEKTYGRRSPDSPGGGLFKSVGPGDVSLGGRGRLRQESPPGREKNGPQDGSQSTGTGAGRTGTLDELVGGSICSWGSGEFYRVLAPAGEIWEDGTRIHREYLDTLAAPFFPQVRGVDKLEILQKVPVEEICYLDIETTGLGSSPLFLIGLMYTEGQRLMLDLLFARDYTEERQVLGFLSEIIRRFTVLVTFNGISFDIPFIAERMSFEKIDFREPEMHLDLLHLARRALGKRTPNHKLQTLEIHLLGRKRVGDIPGRLIPGAYHDFVRSGDACRMAGVIHHNRLDLLSMLELVTVFMSGSIGPNFDPST